MTFPDRVLAYVAETEGAVVIDTDGRVAAVIAKALEEPEVARVKDALAKLQEAKLVRVKGDRSVELTDGGRKAARHLEQDLHFKEVDPDEVRKLRKNPGRRSYGQEVVESFLESGKKGVEVKGLKRSAQSTKQSIDSYLKNKRRADLRDRLLVRVYDGRLYLALIDDTVEG